MTPRHATSILASSEHCRADVENVSGEGLAETETETPPYGQFFVNNFFGVFFILDYDSMCSEMDFTPEKSFSSNYKNSQLLLTAAAALSQNGQIAV